MLRRSAWGLMVPAVFALQATVVNAGWFGCSKQDKCQCPTEQECCRPKHKCCLCPPEAPRGEVAFAIPGVVRSGQAVPISDSAARRGIHEAAAREFRQTTRGVDDSSLEERIDKLEKDVARLGDATNRLSAVVESLDRRLGN